jgi:hypothetical protein
MSVMSLLRNLLARLGRWFSPKPKPAFWFQSKPMGPKYDLLDPETIRIREGDLQGWEFRMTAEISDDEAHVHLFQADKEIGHCDIQRNAHEATVVLWNIVVQERLRHKGLASIMAHTAFRRMLSLHASPSFAIRMVRLVKPVERVTKLQNVGIGVIARKLGFSPQYDLEHILVPRNIQLVEPLPAAGDMPPAYRIVLRIFPLVLIAFLVDPLTSHPLFRDHPQYGAIVKPATVEEWVHDRMIIIGNGNYILKRAGIPEMINHMAASEEEAGILFRHIRPAR